MSSYSRFWAWSSKPPWHIGSCPTCGCLVLLLQFTDGRVALLDPPFGDRRWLRSILAPLSIECQGFASLGVHGDGHVCPPAGACRLPRAAQRVLTYRVAASKGGES